MSNEEKKPDLIDLFNEGPELTPEELEQSFRQGVLLGRLLGARALKKSKEKKRRPPLFV